jgi:hypothetical protein
MIHDVVIDELEMHLTGGGALSNASRRNASRAFYAHLDICPECRTEVSQMEEMSVLLRDLRFDPELASEPAIEPSLGFYNRVRYRILDRKQSEAWGLFSPGAAFFRRIVFASLLLLAGLGSFPVTRESSFSGTDAASIMAQHDPVSAHSETSDRDRMLVTLATYRE